MGHNVGIMLDHEPTEVADQFRQLAILLVVALPDENNVHVRVAREPVQRRPALLKAVDGSVNVGDVVRDSIERERQLLRHQFIQRAERLRRRLPERRQARQCHRRRTRRPKTQMTPTLPTGDASAATSPRQQSQQ